MQAPSVFPLRVIDKCPKLDSPAAIGRVVCGCRSQAQHAHAHARLEPLAWSLSYEYGSSCRAGLPVKSGRGTRTDSRQLPRASTIVDKERAKTGADQLKKKRCSA
eukprot:scaffold21264_cov31-Prasinocladus_malaysianus.AAC.1